MSTTRRPLTIILFWLYSRCISATVLCDSHRFSGNHMNAKKRILIIDDETDITILLRQVLEEASFVVETASNGESGIALATTTHFDLILLDVRMPGMDGLEVLQRLRQFETTRNTPVIFLTGGIPEVDHIVAALDLNPSDFITKSISPKELLARIQWAFRKTFVAARHTSE
jgi:DNA-binding response OmpR family regulator